ncbi:MAG TPA: hypothetical protein VKU41_20850 [Polyangiaceae bacterium]|nr:hypothetical protein [Polyangiaceae bacterium]
MSRRSRPPRGRKSRHSEPIQATTPRIDGPATIAPAAESLRESEAPPTAGPVDELAALDAGWDELLLV